MPKTEKLAREIRAIAELARGRSERFDQQDVPFPWNRNWAMLALVLDNAAEAAEAAEGFEAVVEVQALLLIAQTAADGFAARWVQARASEQAWRRAVRELETLLDLLTPMIEGARARRAS